MASDDSILLKRTADVAELDNVQSKLVKEVHESERGRSRDRSWSPGHRPREDSLSPEGSSAGSMSPIPDFSSGDERSPSPAPRSASPAQRMRGSSERERSPSPSDGQSAKESVLPRISAMSSSVRVIKHKIPIISKEADGVTQSLSSSQMREYSEFLSLQSEFKEFLRARRERERLQRIEDERAQREAERLENERRKRREEERRKREDEEKERRERMRRQREEDDRKRRERLDREVREKRREQERAAAKLREKQRSERSGWDDRGDLAPSSRERLVITTSASRSDSGERRIVRTFPTAAPLSDPSNQIAIYCSVYTVNEGDGKHRLPTFGANAVNRPDVSALISFDAMRAEDAKQYSCVFQLGLRELAQQLRATIGHLTNYFVTFVLDDIAFKKQLVPAWTKYRRHYTDLIKRRTTSDVIESELSGCSFHPCFFPLVQCKFVTLFKWIGESLNDKWVHDPKEQMKIADTMALQTSVVNDDLLCTN